MAPIVMPAGRPKIYATAATRFVQVRVTPEVHHELERLAHERGEAISSIVRGFFDDLIDGTLPPDDDKDR